MRIFSLLSTDATNDRADTFDSVTGTAATLYAKHLTSVTSVGVMLTPGNRILGLQRSTIANPGATLYTLTNVYASPAAATSPGTITTVDVSAAGYNFSNWDSWFRGTKTWFLYTNAGYLVQVTDAPAVSAQVATGWAPNYQTDVIISLVDGTHRLARVNVGSGTVSLSTVIGNGSPITVATSRSITMPTTDYTPGGPEEPILINGAAALGNIMRAAASLGSAPVWCQPVQLLRAGGAYYTFAAKHYGLTAPALDGTMYLCYHNTDVTTVNTVYARTLVLSSDNQTVTTGTLITTSTTGYSNTQESFINPGAPAVSGGFWTRLVGAYQTA